MIMVGFQVHQILKVGGHGITLICTLELSSQLVMPLKGRWDGMVNRFQIAVCILYLKTQPMTPLCQPISGISPLRGDPAMNIQCIWESDI